MFSVFSVYFVLLVWNISTIISLNKISMSSDCTSSLFDQHQWILSFGLLNVTDFLEIWIKFIPCFPFYMSEYVIIPCLSSILNIYSSEWSFINVFCYSAFSCLILPFLHFLISSFSVLFSFSISCSILLCFVEFLQVINHFFNFGNILV